MINSRLLMAACAVALIGLAGCPKGKVPGGVPGVPGGGGGGGVDPNSCGNYAASDAGRKLKAFLQATADLQATTDATVKVVRESCEIIGKEIGMTEADFKGETKDICAAVYGRVNDNMKVAFKGKAALKIKYKPAVCRVNVEAEAKAAAECEGKASADVGATCTGACHGKCDGTCAGKAGTGGSGGECNGECKGTCHGECEGHADVNASAECKASAQAHASAELKCTEPELSIEADAKLVVDKAKAEMTIKGLKNGLPKILSVKARLGPLKHSVEVWAASAMELKSSASKLASSFKDQAMCISGQIAAAASAVGHIEANVSVSVEVSASASGTVGG
jgi:modification target Cys-rich repeat protein